MPHDVTNSNPPTEPNDGKPDETAKPSKAETVGVSSDGGEIAEPVDKRTKTAQCTVSGCHERAEVYQGWNENKTGTAWCKVHGRVTLE